MVPDRGVTAVSINFKTPDLIKRAVTSFTKYYSGFPILLVDNGSHDTSIDVFYQLKEQAPQATELVFNERNIHHVLPWIRHFDIFIRHMCLFLDSDSEVMKGGFVEMMLTLLEENPRHYVVGKRIFMNRRGFDVPEGQSGHPYIRPICMLIKRQIYLTLPPFVRHRAPCLENMISAVKNEYSLIHFPTEEYVDHKGRGTAGRHGYNLGWRSTVNYVMNKFGI